MSTRVLRRRPTTDPIERDSLPTPTATDHPTLPRWLPWLALAAVAVAGLLIGGATAPGFLTFDNWLTILRAASLTGIVAVGMSFVTISGNFFALSLEQTAALTAIVFGLELQHGVALPLALLGALAVAAAVGAVQGAAVAAGANPIVTTIGAGAILVGLASQLANGKNIRFETDAADWIGNGRPLGLPTQSWAFLLTTAAAWFVLRRTRFGRRVYLVGANRSTAVASGISAGATSAWSLVIAAVAAGASGIFVAAAFAQAKVDDFSAVGTNLDKGGTNINVIAAVLIGGVALQGGRGSPLMPAFGAIAIALLQNYMYISGFSIGVRYAVIGIVTVAAVCALHLLRRRAP